MCIASMVWTFLAAWSVSQIAEAWPSSMSCDWSCLSGKNPGDPFGRMGISSYGALTGSNCMIETDIPSEGFVSGQSYTITVKTARPLGSKLGSDHAGFNGRSIVNQGSNVESSTQTWTAPSSSSASFKALCGSGGNIDEMWVSDQLTVEQCTAAACSDSSTAAPTPAPPIPTPAPPTPTPAPPTPTPAPPTPTPAPPTPATPTSEDVPSVELMEGMRMKAQVLDQDIEIEVTSQRNTWVGFGFSKSDTTSMNGNGKGVEAYACTDATVLRYWVLALNQPAGGTAVPGSSCSHVSGQTIMKFRRGLAAETSNSVAITPGTGQVVIFAHGEDGRTSWSFHGEDSGGKNVDMGSLEVSKVAKKSAGASLYMHLIFMTLAWGALMPWGVALANRTRKVSGAPAGAWFKLHRGFNIAGWVLQLIGMVMAIWHVADTGAGHFDSFHKAIGLVVVILGFSQPFIAYFRTFVEKPKAGQPKTKGRFAWEVLHKGIGYVAIVFGILNTFAGILLLQKKDYNATSIVVASVLVAAGLLPVAAYFMLSVYDQNNILSNLCVRGKTTDDETVKGDRVEEPALDSKP